MSAHSLGVIKIRRIAVAVLFAALLLSPQRDESVEAQSAADLRAEGLSVSIDPLLPERRITISFRVVNAGADTRTPFRTRLFPGARTASGFGPYDVTTAALRSGEAVHISRTLTVPRHVGEFDILVEPDAGAASGSAPIPNNTVVKHFVLFPPLPGQWVSIGPRKVTAPAVPGLGLGPYGASGRLAAIAIDPSNPSILYVGSPGELGHEGSGVWKSVNGGKSWYPVTESFPTMAVAALAVDPTNTNRVYAAMVDEGIFRSEDGGTSWTNVDHEDLHLRRNTGDGDRTVLLVDPAAPQVLYLTTDGGVLRSDNAGGSWSPSLSVGTGTESDGSATALVMDPFDHLTLYAAIQGHGVYKTSDGGATPWDIQTAFSAGETSPPSGIRLALSRPSAASPATVYALMGAVQAIGAKFYEQHALYRTTNGGAAWLGRFRCSEPTDDNDGCRGWIMAADPSNADVLYLGGPSLRVSTDGGAQFTRVPASGKEDRQPDAPHGDYHGWAFDPYDSKIVYAATDGGFYRSTDQAKSGTWAFIGEGITNAEVYDLARATAPSVRLIAATQDNGNIRYEGSPTWDHVQPAVPPPPLVSCAGCGGDGGRVAIDPTNEDALFVTGQAGWALQDSGDGGASFTDFPIPTQANCFTYNQSFHLQAHPTQSGILVASCSSVWFGLPGIPVSGTWNSIFAPPTGIAVRTAIDASANLYYVGSSDGKIYAGPAAANFQETFARPQPLNVSDIEVDVTSPQFLYVSFAPPTTLDRKCPENAGRIYQLRRQSVPPTSASTLATDITGNLPPNLCVNALAVDHRSRLTIYAATTKGVYRCRRRLTRQQAWSWESYNDGMPATDVRDLEFDPVRGKIYAGTYGRGAFQAQTPSFERQQ